MHTPYGISVWPVRAGLMENRLVEAVVQSMMQISGSLHRFISGRAASVRYCPAPRCPPKTSLQTDHRDETRCSEELIFRSSTSGKAFQTRRYRYSNKFSAESLKTAMVDPFSRLIPQERGSLVGPYRTSFRRGNFSETLLQMRSDTGGSRPGGPIRLSCRESSL